MTDTAASPALRAAFAVATAVMVGLWAWSLVPPVANGGNPNEDGFCYVPVFYTTLVCLPAAAFLAAGAWTGQGRAVVRARKALLLAGGITVLIASFLIVQHVANSNDGKVFGIQIGMTSVESGRLPLL
jgi:hypothetical protein